MTSLSAVFEETEIVGGISNQEVPFDIDSIFEEIYAQDDHKESITKIIDHRQVWQEIEDEFNTKRKAIEEYKQLKPEVPPNPDVDYLSQNVFPLLLKVLEETIVKAKDLNCLKYQKNTFNGIDYISEKLWNLNPRHPERKKTPTYIFDMEWVKNWLQENPRPFYPFSYVWSREFAATRIQAAMRGHWVRRTEAVQEMRQFWKTLAKEKELNNNSRESISN